MTPLVTTDRLDHVHLAVKDRPAAITWYRDILGLRMLGAGHDDVNADHPIFLAPEGSMHHCLSLFVGPRPQGGDRNVAFHASGQDFLSFAEKLPTEGVRAQDGMPLTADSANDYGAAFTFDFLDPADNQLELVTYDVGIVRSGLAARS